MQLYKDLADSGYTPPSPHIDEADKDLKMNPQEKSFYERHLKNLWGSGGVDNEDGTRSSLSQATVGVDNKTYNIPTVWDGQHLSTDQAFARAQKEGLDSFPSYNSLEEAQSRYNRMHDYMQKDTGDWAGMRQQQPDMIRMRRAFRDAGYDWPEPTRPSGLPKSSDDSSDPGIFRLATTALFRGMGQGTTAFGQGIQAMMPGTKLADFANAPPETQDKVSKLLKTRIGEGWSDPQWWAVQLMSGAGESAPSAALGGLGIVGGGAVGGPAGALAGGAAGFGVGSFVQDLVPAYQRAKAEGLSDKDATTRAIVDSGIAGAFGATMGLVPGISFFGKESQAMANGEIAKVLRRPVMEMLTQIGVVQPALMGAQTAATAVAEGKDIDPGDIFTSAIMGAGTGGMLFGSHYVGGKIARGLYGRGVPPEAQTAATPKTAGEAFEAATSQGKEPPPVGPTADVYDEKQAKEAEKGQATEEKVTPKKIKEIKTPEEEEQAYKDAVDFVQGRETVGTSVIQRQLGLRYGAAANIIDRMEKEGIVSPPDSRGKRTVLKEEAAPAEAPEKKKVEVPSEPEGGDLYDRAVDLTKQKGGTVTPSDIQQQLVNEGYGVSRDDAQGMLDRMEKEGVVGPKNPFGHRQVMAEATPEEMAKAQAVGEEAAPPQAAAPAPRPKRGKGLGGKAEGGKAPSAKELTGLSEEEWLSKDLTNIPGGGSRDWAYEVKVSRKGVGKPKEVPPEAQREIEGERGERTLGGMDRKEFYRDLANDIHHYGPASATGPEWSRFLQDNSAFIREHPTGVLDLPSWLADKYGKIKKGDLLAHLGQQQIVDHTTYLPVTIAHRVSPGPYTNHAERNLYWKPLNGRLTPETVAVVRTSDRIDVDGKHVLHIEEIRPPERLGELPFGTKFPEVVFKRMLRVAADEGYDRVTWPTGDALAERYAVSQYIPLDHPRAMSFMENAIKFYDEILPTIAGNTAIMHGVDDGFVRLFRDNLSSHYIDVSPAAGSRVRQGSPVMAAPITRDTIRIERGVERNFNPETLSRMGAVVRDIGKRLGISKPVTISFTRAQPASMISAGFKRTRGAQWTDATGYHISIHMDEFSEGDIPGIVGVLAHEMGHAVERDLFERMPPSVKAIIRAEHDRWRQQAERGTYSEMILSKSPMTVLSDFESFNKDPMLSLTPKDQEYWLSFKEWFADQVARWATTSAKPMGLLERSIQGIGKAVRWVHEQMLGRFGIKNANPSDVMKGWLDSHLSDAEPFGADVYGEYQLRTIQDSKQAFIRDGTPEVSAVPLHITSVQGRDILANASREIEGLKVEGAAAFAGHADRMNGFYRWMTSLPQLAEMNPHVKQLQKQVEGMKFFNIELRNDADLWLSTAHMFRRLGGPQAEAVAKLMDQWGNMRYRTPDEIALNIQRHPSRDEFEKMVRDNGVSEQGLNVFKKMVADLGTRLDQIQLHLEQKAMKISDPQAQAEALQNAKDAIATIKSRPYFPITRRGMFNALIHRNGEPTGFRRFDTEKQRDAWANKMEGQIKPDEKISRGKFNKDTEPMFNLPQQLLDTYEKGDFKLSQSQRGAMKLLKYEHLVDPAYQDPMDAKMLMRSYAKFFFHSGRYFARAKWIDQFNENIRSLRMERFNRENSDKIDDMANFMAKHRDYVMDPKSDFAALRGLIFNMRLGFSPTTASLYLTQTPLGTIPWLEAHFGNGKGVLAVSKAMLRTKNYYSSDKVKASTASELRLTREGQRLGALDAGAAPALAGMSEDRNLPPSFGGNKLEAAYNKWQETAGTLLHLADSFNRKTAYDAASQLALENPSAKYLDRVEQAYPQTYEDLINKGYTRDEARAVLAGMHTVDQTHFTYQRWARPQFMWGGVRSSLFMFQFWKQNMLFMLWNYPSVAVRSLLVMSAMAGMAGLPFAQDIKGLLKAVGWQLFGKDWDIEKEIREWVESTFDGRVDPDILLHGLSRNSMGIPQVLDAMGHVPYPNLDRSSAIGVGDVLSFLPLEQLGPKKDPQRALARIEQDAAGAAFGFGADLYNFLIASKLDWTDAKRWERVMPHAMLNASRAFRWYREGMERDQSGNPVVKFDPHDTTQMMEILARAAGYNPTRLTAQYEMRTMMEDRKQFWELKKQGIMEQFWQTVKTQDGDARKRVMGAIREFNATLPAEMKPMVAITGEGIDAMIKRKMEVKMERERGTAPPKEMPLLRSIQRLFPSADSVARQTVR